MSVELHSKYKYYIYQQRALPCCVVSSFISLNEYLHQVEGNRAVKFSVLYVYYQSRQSEIEIFNATEEELKYGLHVKSLIDAILDHGIIEQERFPSILPKNRHNIPDANVIASALNHRKDFNIINIQRTPENVKTFIDDNKPVIALIFFNNDLPDIEKSRNIIKPDNTVDRDLGHSILITGYCDDYFIFQNSFGEDWGYNGFGYLSYDYITESESLYTISNCIF